MIKIKNRRYIGNKNAMLPKIMEALENIDIPNDYIVADLFAGTGVVAYEFAQNGHPVIVNDLLYSNYVSYRAWFSNEEIDAIKIKNIIKKFNDIKYEDVELNYFSNIYGDKYFSVNDAKKIGYLRDEIEVIKEELNEREYYILLTSLLYAADKMSYCISNFISSI